MKNPIDKDKVAENPGLLPYPHTIGSIVIKPEDRGQIRSRALTAMYEQTDASLKQIHQQLETLLLQANELKHRREISEQIYGAEIRFEPIIGHVYHLYKDSELFKLMMIGLDQWGKPRQNLEFVSNVKLLSDHTWAVLDGK